MECPNCKEAFGTPLVAPRVESINHTCEHCGTVFVIEHQIVFTAVCLWPDHEWEQWIKVLEDDSARVKQCKKCGAVKTQAVIDAENKYYSENG